MAPLTSGQHQRAEMVAPATRLALPERLKCDLGGFKDIARSEGKMGNPGSINNGNARGRDVGCLLELRVSDPCHLEN